MIVRQYRRLYYRRSSIRCSLDTTGSGVERVNSGTSSGGCVCGCSHSCQRPNCHPLRRRRRRQQQLFDWWRIRRLSSITTYLYFVIMMFIVAKSYSIIKQKMSVLPVVPIPSIDRTSMGYLSRRTTHHYQQQQPQRSLSSIHPIGTMLDHLPIFATVSAAAFQNVGGSRRNHWYRHFDHIQRKRRPSSGRFASSSSSDEAGSMDTNSRYITYLTDVEGDRDYLQRYVEQSKVLCWKEIQNDLSQQPTKMKDRPFPFPYTHYIDFQRNLHNTTKLTTTQVVRSGGPRHRTNDIVVFGGDVWDQGGSDLYVIRQLLDLKLRYPENVFFVMGNRDINKMRIVEEIGPVHTTDDNLPTHHGCYWFENSGRVGDPKLGLLPHNTAVDRLKWMLNYTMGSPRAFEYRRWELQHLCNNSTIITDEDVVESYRQSCDPQTGEMSHFLRNASLLLRIGDVAFLHGAFPFTSENLRAFIQKEHNTTGSRGSLWDDLSFAMPWLKQGVTARDVDVHDANDWVDALNAFAKESVESWVRSNGQSEEIWSLRGGYHPTSAYGQLLQYGMGRTGGTKRGLNPTIVYNRWGIPGTPRKFFRCDPTCAQDQAYVHNTKDFFRRTGIRLICSGHQPAGEMPCHIRIDDHDINTTSWILSGDTSYTGDTVWLNLPGDTHGPIYNHGRGTIKSGRGPLAVSEVLIEQCIATGTILDVHSHGTFSDGNQYRSQSLDFSTPIVPNRTDHDLVVGTVASGKFVPSAKDSPHGGQWWTQAALEDGSILLAAGSGFNYWTRKVLKKRN